MKAALLAILYFFAYLSAILDAVVGAVDTGIQAKTFSGKCGTDMHCSLSDDNTILTVSGNGA